MRDVVNIRISPVNRGENIKVECFVVPEIASIVNEHVEFVKHDYPHLKRLYFQMLPRARENWRLIFLLEHISFGSFRRGKQSEGGLMTL